ncbi:uncharacterized protein LOC123701784 isoform X3 [Colias croceus]|uniref:uncharacterized protein LOC123701784 isoform X3 n=1 Tax=Colias crocea TaxID=72248 RepID=UPI001E279F88|nr:uncharacterized protein LOC123701784 isoform X3 [Colias croceus]
MTSKSEKDRAKQIQDRCQNILLQMLKDEDNKYCVDCDAKGPRWASWNLGIFLCIRCAGIHRNLGVHISKVKSVNLDSWTPEQVVSLQQMGNSRARAVYEANLPDSFRRPQNDNTLEGFIRAKYEQKKYIAKEWVPPPLPKVNCVKRRRVSGRQLDLLWEYLDSHRDLACALNRSLQAKEYATRKWKEIADLLNEQGDGALKDWREWSKYWVDYKAKLKKRASVVRSSQTLTGDETGDDTALSERDLKFLQLMAEDHTQGPTEVPVEPYPEPSDSTTSITMQDSSSSLSIHIHPSRQQGNTPTLTLLPLRAPTPVYEPVQTIEPDPYLLAALQSVPKLEPRPASRTPSPEPSPEPSPVPTPSPKRYREMTRASARRALVQSARIRARAAVRSSRALEVIGRSIRDVSRQMRSIRSSLGRIESYMAMQHGGPRPD